MSGIQARVLESRKLSYQQKFGKLHPEVEALPPEVQIRLLDQADEEGVELSAAAIDAELTDIEDRIAIARQAAALLKGADDE